MRLTVSDKIWLGGSFNPVHEAHLRCARRAADELGIKTVVLVPTGLAPHKQKQADMADASDRLAMCRLAVEGMTGFEVDDRETRRMGPSFTIQTVRELKKAVCDPVRWLIGADMVNGLPTWHQSRSLLLEAEFYVMARPGWTIDWEALPEEFRELRNRVVTISQMEISASEIRKRVKEGRSIEGLTPQKVVRYIAEHGLYR